MTEQELNNRIAEILESTKAENGCGRRTGRQYRRSQSIRHSDHLLFLIQHSGYAPNMGYIIGDYERITTLLHSGLHIQYMKSSNRQQYLKRKGNRKVRNIAVYQRKGTSIVRYLTTGGSSIELQRGVGSVIKYRAGAVLHCGIQHLIDVTIPPFQQHLYS